MKFKSEVIGGNFVGFCVRKNRTYLLITIAKLTEGTIY